MHLRGIAIACAAAIILSGCSVNENQAKKEQGANPTAVPAVVETAVTEQTGGFDENQAVAAVLKEQPEFPQAGQAKEIEVVTGGLAPGTKIKGTLATTVAASSTPGIYTVTLTKNLDFIVNDEKLRGYWIYEATAKEIRLIESNDNTSLIETVK